MQNKQDTTKLPAQISLIARLLIAGYLIYTVVSLGDVWNRYAGAELMMYMGAMILFFFVAIIMGFFSLRDLMRGRYIGGTMDNNQAVMEELCEKEVNNTKTEEF